MTFPPPLTRFLLLSLLFASACGSDARGTDAGREFDAGALEDSGAPPFDASSSDAGAAGDAGNFDAGGTIPTPVTPCERMAARLTAECGPEAERYAQLLAGYCETGPEVSAECASIWESYTACVNESDDITCSGMLETPGCDGPPSRCFR